MDLSKVGLALTALQPQIQMAQMLIGLGVSTVTNIKAFFAAQGHDEDVLAAIDAEVTARLARRS